jgi:hypothetical protein
MFKICFAAAFALLTVATLAVADATDASAEPCFIKAAAACRNPLWDPGWAASIVIGRLTGAVSLV